MQHGVREHVSVQPVSRPLDEFALQIGSACSWRRHGRRMALRAWASSLPPDATRCSGARIRTTRIPSLGRIRSSDRNRMLVAATRQTYGPEGMGIVASTGCNTVFGSTYPYNPYLVPWTNSLFEHGPAVAMGIRARWDQAGHPDRRLWVIGGDGAMFDIGFGALSRMVASGADIKVLVLDTQVYSNTGGQASTASFGGQITKLSAYGRELHGRPEPRKELGRILAAHGNAYVAQTTPAHINHFYRTILEANAYPGPAVVIAYTACMPEHGIADDAASRQA